MCGWSGRRRRQSASLAAMTTTGCGRGIRAISHCSGSMPTKIMNRQTIPPVMFPTGQKSISRFHWKESARAISPWYSEILEPPCSIFPQMRYELLKTSAIPTGLPFAAKSLKSSERRWKPTQKCAFSIRQNMPPSAMPGKNGRAKSWG